MKMTKINALLLTEDEFRTLSMDDIKMAHMIVVDGVMVKNRYATMKPEDMSIVEYQKALRDKYIEERREQRALDAIELESMMDR